jgi:hypothetical protein
MGQLHRDKLADRQDLHDCFFSPAGDNEAAEENRTALRAWI